MSQGRNSGSSFWKGILIVSLLGACGLRILWIFTLFQTETFHKPMYLYVTYPASWGITFLLHLICFCVVWRRLRKPNEN